MPRGRPPSYQDPVMLTLKCERHLHDAIKCLKVSDAQVYSRGAFEIVRERSAELTSEQIQVVIQEKRRIMHQLQEDIAFMERVEFDNRVKAETVGKKKKVQMHYEGKPYQAVISE